MLSRVLPMSRSSLRSPFAVARSPLAATILSAMVAMAWALGCGSSGLYSAKDDADAGAVRREASPVDPPSPGPALDAGLGPSPSCERYCELVTANCTGDRAQYGSVDECLAFCAHVPLEETGREVDEKEAASVACRQYWADGPSRTSPETYCLAAGPFGDNACGDRCTAFCGVVLSACPPDGDHVAYRSHPECATDCAGFSFVDSGADGGGEGPDGPSEGDSLNCRLYWLRAATMDAGACVALAPQSEACQETER